MTGTGGTFRASAIALALAAVAPAPAAAQRAGAPTGFSSMPGDDHWDDQSKAQAGVSADLKAIDVAPDITFDLGGSIKERVEAFEHPFFEAAPTGRDADAFLLHRVLLHANVRLGTHLRGFIEFEEARQTGRSPGPLLTDANHGDIAQAFVEVAAASNGADFGVRFGRQEMAFGSRRLIGLREGANVRQRFSGLRGWWRRGRMRVDAFSVRPMSPRLGSLDDGSDPTRRLSGVHAAVPLHIGGRSAIDAYVYRSTSESMVLDAGRARELRNTIGLRWSGTADRLTYDIEGVVQDGSFGTRRIAANALFVDASMVVVPTGLRPTVGIRADRISGGSDDRTVRTFNPLYSRVALINEANLQTYANLTDVFPYASMQPSRTVTLTAGVDFQWRTNRGDSFYAPPLTPLFPGNDNRFRALGNVYTAQADWTANPNLSVSIAAVRYDVRGFLRAAGAHDTTWFGAWSTFRF